MKSIYRNQAGSLLTVLIIIFVAVIVVLAGFYTKYRIDTKEDTQKSNQQVDSSKQTNQNTPLVDQQQPDTSTNNQNNDSAVVQGAGFKVTVPNSLYSRNCLTESNFKDNLVSVAKSKDDLWCHGTGQGEYYSFSCDPTLGRAEINSTMPARIVNGVTFYQTYNNASNAATFITYQSQENATGNYCTVGYTSQKGLDLDTFNKVFDTLIIE